MTIMNILNSIDTNSPGVVASMSKSTSALQEHDDAAKVIQNAWRTYREEKLKAKNFAASRIQKAWKAFQTRKDWGSDEICSVCRNAISRKLFSATKKCEFTRCIQTSCNHIFHKKCLTEWVTRDLSCPLCKSRLDRKEIGERLHKELVLIYIERHNEMYGWAHRRLIQDYIREIQYAYIDDDVEENELENANTNNNEVAPRSFYNVVYEYFLADIESVGDFRNYLYLVSLTFLCAIFLYIC